MTVAMWDMRGQAIRAVIETGLVHEVHREEGTTIVRLFDDQERWYTFADDAAGWFVVVRRDASVGPEPSPDGAVWEYETDLSPEGSALIEAKLAEHTSACAR